MPRENGSRFRWIRLRDKRHRTTWSAAIALLVVCLFVPPISGGSGVLAQEWNDEKEGLEIYQAMCAGCHQEGGRGVPGMFPSLRENAAVQGIPTDFIRIVLHGRGAMPGFADRLDDEDVAELVTFIRSNWENRAAPVSDAAVADARTRGPGSGDGMLGAAELPDGWRDAGEELVRSQCLTCHKEGGVGVDGVFPPLAGNGTVLGDPGPLIRIVVHGRGAMPSFGELEEQQLANILSYIRTAWGNDASFVTPSMIARAGRNVSGPPRP